ncbi:MAG: hypothetical protein IT361_15605 [Gemmatimonadaceae bacterium]|nr:hypothetical protein [Gemmatimonadaceae bacterium]
MNALPWVSIRFVRLVWPAVATLLMACVAPRVRPMAGVPFSGPLPRTALPAGHARLVFRWVYDDPIFGARGEGVARLAPPDSVRLDFFVDGGVGSGGAILIADSLRTAGDDGRRYLPPVPLLWAALGVLRVTGSDTVARMDGDTLRVEIGQGIVFRASFGDTALVSLGRIEGGRLREQVRRDATSIVYRHFSGRRSLTLSALRRFQDPPYAQDIWRP